MKQKICKNCARFRQCYYKGPQYLMPLAFGICKRNVRKTVLPKEKCELFEEKTTNAATIRQANILEHLSFMMEEINEFRLMLASDKQESN